ncbi:MAG TPA: hypothetical protein DDZ68_00140, partial [Parvularcula sp.]|nr:hypothetical protein [Parvularcula sp.]
CAHLRPRLARLLALKRAKTLSVLSSLEEQKLVAFQVDEKDRLAERIAAHFTYWLQYRTVTEPEKSDRARINDAVYATILQIAPYLTSGRSAYLKAASEHFAAAGKKRS